MSPAVSKEQTTAQWTVLPKGKPAFSVVIPAYNRELTVLRAIKSALAQSYQPDEILVVDDGSSDNTSEVVAKFGGIVRVIRQDNGGAPVARNTGVREAGCEWIAFLDSDDYWMPDHLARMADAIEGTSGRADFYFANIQMAENEGGKPQWERAEFGIDGDFEMLEDATPWVVRKRIPMMLQASVFHRERLLSSGSLWEALPMRDDTHVFLRHGLSGGACAVNYVGCEQTSDDDSGIRLTTTISNKTLRYWLCSVRLWRDLLKGAPHLNRGARLVLKGRLAVSHMRAARLSMASGSVFQSAGHFLRGILVQPRSAMTALLARAGAADAPKA